MSYRYSSSSRDRDSSRYSSSRRDSPPRHRSSSRRSPSPGPSRSRREESKDPKTLPESFGRGETVRGAEDDSNILQRMKTHYDASPLSDFYYCITNNVKIKIWTRNFKEVRGVMTGYIIAFDKHWNVVLRDVDEVYLKPKKSKTPFLRLITPSENLPDIPAKVPKGKKDDAKQEAEKTEEPPAQKEGGDEKKKRRARRKKAKSTSAKRHISKLFVRGDNIVMVSPMEGENQTEEEEEEIECEEGESKK